MAMQMLRRSGFGCQVLGLMLLFSCALPGLAAQTPQPSPPAEPPQVSLTGTAVYELSFQGRTYPVWVDVPASYHSNQQDYPLLLVTDAPYAFPLIRSIRNRVGQQGQNIEDFILVGLAYPATDTPAFSRSRDYTTSDVKARPAKPDENYDAPAYGNAPAFSGFIATQVLPLLQQKYRLDRQRQIYLGHSYGALLGAYVLLHQPDLFRHYVLSSPSLWFDQRRLLEQTPTLLRKLPARISAKIWLYIGGFEQPGPSARHYKTLDMVGDMQAFAKRLSPAKGLKVKTQVIDGEDHLTVFPPMVTRAMLEILPGKGTHGGK
jgi:predicted alpha/beta superfamily hydrolase